MPSADRTGTLRAAVRRMTDRFFMSARALPGLRARSRESFGIEQIERHQARPMREDSTPAPEDQDHPEPPRLEHGHPKR
jgi:hypothetical protein